MSTPTKNTDTILWREPPTKHLMRVKPTIHERTLAKLKTRPGEWARVQVRPQPGGVAYLNKSLSATGEVETTTRTLSNGATGLWARYTGPKKGS